MPDFLATKDWKSVLDLKENKTVKKTGISETLDDYASAKKKDDIGKMVSALERVVDKANDVKSAQKDKKTIVDFLTKTIIAAKTEQQKLAVRLKDKDDTDEDNEDNSLGKALIKVRQLTADTAWHFVLAPGKPSSGLVITKKPILKASIDKAFEMKGKRGPYFIGRSYHDQSKFVFALEDKPLPGLAKAAKNAALLHAEMNIKVLIRGAGVELDGDSDLEPQEEGSGPTGAQPLLNEGRFSTYQARVRQVDVAVGKFETSPNAKADGAADGILGAIRVLSGQIEGDTALTKDMREELLADLDASRLRAELANTAPVVKPIANYPALPYWAGLAEGIVRLDPSRSQDAWKKFNARLTEVQKQFDDDKALVDPDRSTVAGVLKSAAELFSRQEISTGALYNRAEEKGNEALARRIEAMERRHDQILKTEGLDPQQVSSVARAFMALRGTFREGKLTDNDPRIAQVELALEKMAQLAFAKQRETARQSGQKQMHDAIKPGMEFMKKAALPTGLIKDPTAMRQMAQDYPPVRTLLESMGTATKTPGKDSGTAMETAARQLLAYTGLPDDLIALANQVLVRGTMMRLVDEYKDVGDPPWDTGKADVASELQAQLFFLESAITQGNPNYTAPGLGGQSGASGSWWIERAEPTVNDKTGAKKTYIFKPGNTEAAVMTGLQPGSGAPREVLAKRLDEMMSGAGFAVGVSPTTLATLDSSLLGDLDMPKGPLLGSVQQLAPSDGTLNDKAGDFVAFSKTIDKKSFDDVAVFDMIFANLDRHAKNMLFATDPVTGKSKLVPIDHGSSLPDPLDLQANRSALLPDFNIMANKDMVPAQQPLGDETVEALLRLDPARMMQEMKQARDDLKQRHPSTDGTLSDDAIEAMGARVYFMRAAAEARVPVAMIFEMLAVGALRIAKASPQNMPALLKTLLKEATDATSGRAEMDKVYKSSLDVGGKVNLNLIAGVLKGLGWGWSLDGPKLFAWVNDNPKLAARILKAQQVNPAIDREIQRLLPLALVNDPQIEKKMATSGLVERYNSYFQAAYRDMVRGPDFDTPPDQLDQMLQSLGGMAEIKTAAKVFPFECAALLEDANPTKPEEVIDKTLSRIKFLRQWTEFEKTGGLAETIRLGGSMPRESNVLDSIIRLTELKSSAIAAQQVLDLDDEDVDELAGSQYKVGAQDLTDMITTFKDKSNVTKFTLLSTKSAKSWQEGDSAAALTTLASALTGAKAAFAGEQLFINKTKDRVKQVQEAFKILEPSIQQKLQPAMQGIYDLYQRAIDTCALMHKESADREFEVRKDIAAEGDNSRYAKLDAEVNLITRREASHDLMPWSMATKARLNELNSNLTGFNLELLSQNINRLTEILNAVDLLKQALGDADLNTLPQAVTSLLQEWSVNIRDNSKIHTAPAAAQTLRALLEPAQI